MVKIKICDFAIWNGDKESAEGHISYTDSSVKKLNNIQIPIIDAIIENGIKNDNYITAAEITSVLESKGNKKYDREQIKKTIQRIKKDPHWGKAIESTGNGYRITGEVVTTTQPQARNFKKQNKRAEKIKTASGKKSSPKKRTSMANKVNSLDKLYFRKKEIDDIKKKLLSKRRSMLALSADGGIGKSTIAKEIYDDIQIHEHYSMVVWIDYVGTLDDSILSSLDLYTDISDRDLRLSRIRQHFDKINSKVLLIIDNIRKDNINKQDPLNEIGVFTPLNLSKLSAYVDVVITTRLSTIPEYEIIRISGFSRNKELSTELFEYHYNLISSSPELTDKDISDIEAIVSASKGNPFIIMLLARQAANSTINKFSKYMKKCKHQTLNIAQLIKYIIDYKNNTDEEKLILLGFATLPNIFITDKECSKWLNFDISAVNELVNEGWLEIEVLSETRYRMHDLVKQAIRTCGSFLIEANELRDNDNYKMTFEYVKSEGLIPMEQTPYAVLIDNPEDPGICNTDDYSQVIRLIEMLRACLKFNILDNIQRAKISHWIASYSYKYTNNTLVILSHYHYALRCLRLAADYAINDKEEVEFNRILSDYYYDYGCSLSSLESSYFRKAEQAFSKAKVYCDLSKKSEDHDFYGLSADNYLDYAIRNRKPSHLNKKILQSIAERKYAKIRMEAYARILNQWGYVIALSSRERYDTAQAYLEIAYIIVQALYSLIPTRYKQLYASVEDNLGYLYFHANLQNSTLAEELLNDALVKRESLLLESRDKYMADYQWTYNNCAELYSYIGGKANLLKAEQQYIDAIEIAIELNDKTNGKYEHFIAWSKYGLGCCYAKQGNYGEAKAKLKEAHSIYCELAKSNPSYIEDCTFVENTISSLKGKFKQWVGNHSHFSYSYIP